MLGLGDAGHKCGGSRKGGLGIVPGLALSSSEGRNPPIQRKQRSAVVRHIPEMRWNTSALAAMPLMRNSSS